MDQLLAKPDQSLEAHTRRVLQLGKELVSRLDMGETLIVKALLACALHDVGKATRDFQTRMQALKAGRTVRRHRQEYPHALASLPVVLVAENSLGKRWGWKTDSLHATAAVLSHHTPLGAEVYRGFGIAQYHPQIEHLMRRIWQMLGEILTNLPSFEQVFCDWQRACSLSLGELLDSSVSNAQSQSRSLRGMLQRLPMDEFAQVKMVLHLADWLASSHNHQIGSLFLHDSKQKVVQYLNRPEVTGWYGYQQRCAQANGEVLWLRAPTGTGKTEALLLWAGDAQRLIYLLPTQATVNAMRRRLQRIYGEQEVGLAHGRANYILRQQTHMEEEPLDERLLGSVFAKPVSVATLDQYLLAHLNGRHWEERRALTKHSVLVLDEIHAYEPYTLGMLAEALSRESPRRLAFASATLPSALQHLFPEGEIIEAEQSLWERKRHRLVVQEGMLLQSLEEVMQFARQDKKVLIVANTVADAQAIYRMLQEQYHWNRLHLLHAQFIFRHRQQKEKEVSEAVPGTVFVATQVVEVSLDIDYDVLLTEIAPIDALVQRMGRVNRQAKRQQAPVYLFTRWGKGTERVYGREVLETSLHLLKQLSELPTDRDLAEATEALYEQITKSREWLEDLQAGRGTLREVQQILGCYTIDLSDEEMRSRFTARRGTVSVEVIPEQFVQEAYQLREIGQGWRMPELLVPVPIYWLKRYPTAFEPSQDLGVFITSLEYNSQEGLTNRLSGNKVLIA